MTPPATARVLVTLDERLAQAAAEQQGALWRLAEPGRGLDANVVRLAPGNGVAEHSDDVLDVLLVVLDGHGRLSTPAGSEPLTPHSVVWLPRTSRRALTAGERGLVYLTAHRRRPGLSVAGVLSGRNGTPSGAWANGGGESGGEPPCALNQVCAECGHLAQENDARFCARCGRPLPD
ncbi:hypothetical protein ACIOWG_24240 [Streptomyces sp. NPDC087658]|uniref:hypothetical protein n=1 Tax=Streptomyces sp. NPDC087658 TaxID=3365800 RepID=UPI0037F8746B